MIDFNSNIPDELLAAFIDGNTTAEENMRFMQAVGNDHDLQESLDIVKDSIDLNSESEWNYIPFDRFDAADVSILEKINDLLTDNTLEEMKTQSYNVWGEGGENLMDPVYVRQPDDHSCALRSQQIVLRDYGIDIPFEKLEQLAKEHGVYSDEGTYTYDIGKVLQIAGVGMHQVEGSTLMDLTHELAQGHRVIVSVDADELWYNDTMAGKLKNWFNDTIGNQGGNHALIVAGVEVNPNDPNDTKVVLTDPGAGHLRIEYPLDQFMDAWRDSNCFMAATDNPAPYQYDASTGMEVPSNFVVQQYVNDFIASNGYQLSPDMINIPQDYQPVLTDHINMVGNVDYDTFESEYESIVGKRIPSELTIKEQIENVARNHDDTLNGETTGSVGVEHKNVSSIDNAGYDKSDNDDPDGDSIEDDDDPYDDDEVDAEEDESSDEENDDTDDNED